MCTFCDNNWKLTDCGVTSETPRNNYAELIPWFGTREEKSSLPINRWVERGKSISCKLLESGEGAAWDNRTTEKRFPINYCPICGKFLGKTVEINYILQKNLLTF